MGIDEFLRHVVCIDGTMISPAGAKGQACNFSWSLHSTDKIMSLNLGLHLDELY